MALDLMPLFNRILAFRTKEVAQERDKWKAEAEQLKAELVKAQDSIQGLRTDLSNANVLTATLHLALKQARDDLAKETVTVPPPSVTLVERPAEWVEEQFRKYIGVVGGNGYLLFPYQNVRVETDGRNAMLRHPLDAKYKLPATLDDLNVMLAWARELDTRQWGLEFWDCDDRAKHLSAMLAYHFDVELGMVIDYHAAHVFNLAMLADGSVFLVEPEDTPPSVYALEAQKYPMLTGTFWF